MIRLRNYLIVPAILFFGMLGINWIGLQPGNNPDNESGGISSHAIYPVNSDTNVDEDNKPMPIYGNWKNYKMKDGLPSDKVYCVRVDGDRVWAGTNNGLALLEDGKWKVYTVEDGLAHKGVLSIDISPVTGDLWVATLSGLNRFSGGKFDKFTQFNSGLANDVIYTVVCDGKDVWVATGGGAGSYDTYTKQWGIYTDQNAPMHEPWTYGVCAGGGKVFIAAWGGGVIEYTKETKQFRDYVDPDGEMEIDLFPDDGVCHDITTGVSYDDDILWVATYFGLSRYDGTHWKGYFDKDSGLASDFINFLRAKGSAVYLCTDEGLSGFNGETWVTYRPHVDAHTGDVIITEGDKVKTIKANNSLSHNFIIGVDFSEDSEVIWVATSKGLSRGEVIGETNTHLSKK